VETCRIVKQHTLQHLENEKVVRPSSSANIARSTGYLLVVESQAAHAFLFALPLQDFHFLTF